MAKRKSTKKNRRPKKEEYTPVYLTQYEITDEPIEERAYRQLPKSVKGRLEKLHHDAQFHPMSAIEKLLKLRKKYPQVPQIYNYLAVAYSRTGEIEKLEEITKENIRKNPNYLFAKINYAEFCLQREEYEKIPEIFDQKFDLQMLYPNRKKFHVTEFANFMGVIGIYFLRTGQRELAERYNKTLQEIASEYPAAERLDFELKAGNVMQTLRRLVEKQRKSM
jgi:tetratricopeptide (TPR) repeat protein